MEIANQVHRLITAIMKTQKVINEELDIFSDAKFGSKYVTRNGDIALYLCDCILVIGGTVTLISYNQRGIAIGKDNGYDIVEKYNLWYKIKNHIKKKYYIHICRYVHKR